MANCVKCGATLQLGAKICEYCGSVAELQKVNQVSGSEPEQGAAQINIPVSELRFKRVSVVAMVVLTIITTGLYFSIWFYVRRRQFAELSTKKNLRSLFGGLLGVHIFYLLGCFAYWGSPDADLLTATSLFGYVFMGVMIYSAIIARAALAETAASRGSKFAGSIVWTVFFNALYLQSQINRMLDARILGEQP